MKKTIAESLFRSHSYPEYRTIVSNLVAQGKSSGNEQSADLLHYSTLNEARLKRLDKTIKTPESISNRLKALKKEYIWLVLSEGWCGDAAQILPILNKMVLETDKIDLKIVFRDENDELMNEFLTNGGRAIPKLIVIEKETGLYCGQWGPRPLEAIQLIHNYKKIHGIIDEEAKSQLQLWYLQDKGNSTQIELITLMESL